MARGFWPKDIGIKAFELYTPNQCVNQVDLEKHDGVSNGKYTLGLGQERMGFCDDREDIYALTLTAVSLLLKKYDIPTSSIGRLEVGTETIIDKSKSVKSVLMQLFSSSGNTDIEGVDTVNACYGGTNALLNAVNWIESSSWDGRDAIVVAGDIAIYERGPARPTGGAGVVAMLIGTDAPLVIEPARRGSYMQHAYDFYKPNLTSEYPVVDGQYSIECYTRALDACYKAYMTRSAAIDATSAHSSGDSKHTNRHVRFVNGCMNGDSTSKCRHDPSVPVLSELELFDYMCFHSPNCKLVAKSYGRLLYNDFRAKPDDPRFDSVPHAIRTIPYEDSLKNREIEKTFLSLAGKAFNDRVAPTTMAAAFCGNMYTASLFGSLASLICSVPSETLYGKRIGMFSYGSGLASTLFSIKVTGPTTRLSTKLDLQARLSARHVLTPVQYEEALALREKAHLRKGYAPLGNIDLMAKGTYYLVHIDELFRRFYHVKR